MIPIYYHIPKCGGTFVKNLMIATLRRKHKNNLRLYQLTRNEYTIGIVYCNSIDLPIPKSSHNNVFFNVEYDDFLKHKHLINTVYAVIINARGFSIHEEIKSHFPTSLSFTLLREPLDRQQSLFNYLSSDVSRREKTHGAYKSKTLQEFLGSYEVEDCWLIRVFLGLEPNQIITQQNFDATCQILDKMLINDFKDARSTVDTVLKRCYEFTTVGINTDKLYSNSNPIPKLGRTDIDSKTLETFDNRTGWDSKLYNRYVNKSQS